MAVMAKRQNVWQELNVKVEIDEIEPSEVARNYVRPKTPPLYYLINQVV